MQISSEGIWYGWGKVRENNTEKEKEEGRGHCPLPINRINLRNDLDGEDMNNEINK